MLQQNCIITHPPQISNLSHQAFIYILRVVPITHERGFVSSWLGGPDLCSLLAGLPSRLQTGLRSLRHAAILGRGKRGMDLSQWTASTSDAHVTYTAFLVAASGCLAMPQVCGAQKPILPQWGGEEHRLAER